MGKGRWVVKLEPTRVLVHVGMLAHLSIPCLVKTATPTRPSSSGEDADAGDEWQGEEAVGGEPSLPLSSPWSLL